MIVIVGQPGDRGAARIAQAAANAGGRVQFVSRIADDAAGDRMVLELAAAQVGHVATLRQPPPASALEAADLDLALRYLADVGVVVLSDPDDAMLRVGADAAGWSRGSLVVIVPTGSIPPAGVPDTAIVIEAPASDPDAAFAMVVGDLAARLDAGADPEAAFAATMADRSVWTRAEGDEPLRSAD